MTLPFTSGQFFDVFAAYNRALWFFALALWLYAMAGAVILARSNGSSRFLATLLAIQWAWAGLAYHFAFFSVINPAAWLFGGTFLIQSLLFAWFGIVRERLHFSPTGSLRHIVAWILIVYALAYPGIVLAEGHEFPAAPSFGVPCPTTLLTIGVLLAAERPWPRAIAVIPTLWALVAGSTALLLGVRADLMLWPAAIALVAHLFVPARSSATARITSPPERATR